MLKNIALLFLGLVLAFGSTAQTTDHKAAGEKAFKAKQYKDAFDHFSEHLKDSPKDTAVMKKRAKSGLQFIYRVAVDRTQRSNRDLATADLFETTVTDFDLLIVEYNQDKLVLYRGMLGYYYAQVVDDEAEKKRHLEAAQQDVKSFESQFGGNSTSREHKRLIAQAL